MSNEKFTHGPWVLRLIESTEPGLKKAHPVYWSIAGEKARAAIQVYKQPKGTLIEAEATANLIAAAPDMYQMLKDALFVMEKWADGVQFPTILAIKETLNKANPQTTIL